jgi:hypothetical protein
MRSSSEVEELAPSKAEGIPTPFPVPAPPKGILPAQTRAAGTFPAPHPYLKPEDVMRAYLANLTPTARMLLAVPALAIAYALVTIVVPAAIRAVVPDLVRSLLSLM